MSYFGFQANRKNQEEDLDDFMKRKSTLQSSKDTSPIKNNYETGSKSVSNRGTPIKNSEISPVKAGGQDSAFTTSTNNYFPTTSPTKMSSLSVNFQDSDKKSYKSIESNEIIRDNPIQSLTSPIDTKENVFRKGAMLTKSPNPVLDFNRKDVRRSNDNSASPRFSKSNSRSPLADSGRRDSKSQNHRSQPTSPHSNTSSEPYRSALKKSGMSDMSAKKAEGLTMTFRKDYDQMSDSSKKYSGIDRLTTSLTWDNASENTVSPANFNNRSFQFPNIPKLAMDKVSGVAPRSRHTTTRSGKLETIYSSRTDCLVSAHVVYSGTLPNSIDCLKDPTEEIIKDLKKKREKYQDSLFKPAYSSLVNSTKYSKNVDMQGLQWRRLAEIYKGVKTYITQEVTPLQVEPGILKDYGMVSALALLAEKPDLIKALFANQYFNEEGCYAAKICKDGSWIYCLIDDFVPILIDKQGTINPAFIRSQQGKRKHIDFWPILLEKAWAKTFHTYENIEGCDSAQILRDLTGAPCNSIEVSESNIWNVITNSLSDDSLILAVPKTDDFATDALNINKNFAKAVLGTVTLKKKDEKIKLIKIRNLWSDDHPWLGLWHYKSDQWIPELKQEIGIDKCIEEKVLFLTTEEFCNCFGSVQILRVQPSYKYSSITLRHAKLSHTATKFTISKDTNCHLELTQVDHAFYRRSEDYSYSTVRVIVGRVDENGSLEYQVGHCGNTKYTDLRLNLDAGEYYVYVMVEWGVRVLDVNLSAYADEEIQFEKVPYDKRKLADMMQLYIGQSFPPTVLDHDKDFKKFSLEFAELKMIAEVYRNDSKDKRLSMRRSLNEMRMCNYLNFKSENSAFDITVEAGKSLLLLFGKNL